MSPQIYRLACKCLRRHQQLLIYRGRKCVHPEILHRGYAHPVSSVIMGIWVDVTRSACLLSEGAIRDDDEAVGAVLAVLDGFSLQRRAFQRGLPSWSPIYLDAKLIVDLLIRVPSPFAIFCLVHTFTADGRTPPIAQEAPASAHPWWPGIPEPATQSRTRGQASEPPRVH